jgi:hypothetical protein
MVNQFVMQKWNSLAPAPPQICRHIRAQIAPPFGHILPQFGGGHMQAVDRKRGKPLGVMPVKMSKHIHVVQAVEWHVEGIAESLGKGEDILRFLANSNILASSNYRSIFISGSIDLITLVLEDFK